MIKPKNKNLLSFVDKFPQILYTNPIILYKPHPPSLSINPAKTMEPNTGASTWALGNHMWKKNTGNLTKKAKIKNTLIQLNFISHDWCIISEEIIWSFKDKIRTKRGRDANNVKKRR